jgi:hypothetical protein
MKPLPEYAFTNRKKPLRRKAAAGKSDCTLRDGFR